MSKSARNISLFLLFLTLPQYGHAAKLDEKKVIADAFRSGGISQATQLLQQYFTQHCSEHVSLSTPKIAVGSKPVTSSCSILLGAIARMLFVQEKYAEAVPYMTGIVLNSEHTPPGYRQTCRHYIYEFDASRFASNPEQFLGQPHTYDFNTDYYIALDRSGDSRARERGYQAFLCRSLELSGLELSGILSWKVPDVPPLDAEFLAFAGSNGQERDKRDIEMYLSDILPGLKGAKLPEDYTQGLAAKVALYSSVSRRAISLGLGPPFSSFFDRLVEDKTADLRTSISVKNQY